MSKGIDVDMDMEQKCCGEVRTGSDSVTGDHQTHVGCDVAVGEKTEVINLGMKEDIPHHQFAVPDIPIMKADLKISHKIDSGVRNASAETDKEVGKLEKNSFLSEKSKKNVPQQLLEELPKGKKCDFPYSPPPWGGVPCVGKNYSLTILKEGIVRDTIDLSRKSTLTFGRHPTACDVLVEHPSCSRYHAVLQYCVEEKDVRKVGYYLYDMGSTHGCYVNKERMRPKVYVRVRVGYQIQFGGSSRRYIMEGPSEDQEDEVDIEEIRKIQERKKQSMKSTIGLIKPDSDGIGASWGFKEDAQEEELDLKALIEKKKTIEVKDPKKTLKGFFEREGLDFEYEMSERGRGGSMVHVAQVHLPIESSLGNEIVAEGTSTNKKDAVLNCAIDACKIIQAYDMMHNPLREGEHEKRRRQLEENDFYDSEDDNFFDRTGSIEKKRLKRKQFAGKQMMEVSTHDSMKKELSEKLKLLASLEHNLMISLENDDVKEGDTLDTFMSNIAKRLSKKEKNVLKRQIIQIKKDIEKIEMLVEKTLPALPALNIQEVESNKTLSMEKVESVVEGGKSNHPVESTKIVDKPNEQTAAEKHWKKNQGNCYPKKKCVHGPVGIPRVKDRDAMEEEKEKELSEWQPPEGQTGDGRTHLNEKLGY